MPGTIEIIHRALVLSDEIWTAWHRPDTCIAACRVLQRALREIGIRPLPVVARVECYNAVLVEAMNSGHWESMTDAERLVWRDEVNAWGVGLGFDDPAYALGIKRRPPNHSGIHVCLIEPIEQILIDPTLGQASRPAKNLILPQSIVAPATNDFIAGKVTMRIGFNDGVEARYTLFPGEAGRWLVSPDWIESKRSKSLSKQIIRGLKTNGITTRRTSERGRSGEHRAIGHIKINA